MELNNYGKKTFFLYPHSVIKKDLMQELIASEYEVYIINDYKRVKAILKHFKNSILFINIDENLKEQEWIDFIKVLIAEAPDTGVQIGILTYNENDVLAQKYLMDIGVPCGFIQLNLGKDKSKGIILKTLEFNESKGQRKYIRANATNKNATFNVKIGNDLFAGNINDISSVGMSCTFDVDIGLKKNAILRKIQLKLQGKLVLVDGIVFGSRAIENNINLYVVMFTNNMSDDTKDKVHSFIGNTIQEQIDREIDSLFR
jgi:hypothetical protein